MDRISFRMSRTYIVFSALVCLLGFMSFFLTRSSTPSPIPLRPNNAEPLPSATCSTRAPYTSSWASWWHPQRTHGRGSSKFGRGWNLLYHLGGNGPWIEKVDGVVKGGIGVPECRVEQVHMVGLRSIISGFAIIFLGWWGKRCPRTTPVHRAVQRFAVLTQVHRLRCPDMLNAILQRMLEIVRLQPLNLSLDQGA